MFYYVPATTIAAFYTVPTLVVAAILGGVAVLLGLVVAFVALASKDCN